MGYETADTEPLVIARQGSFSVGGRLLQGASVIDGSASMDRMNQGRSTWVDQMYVQYQIPLDPRIYPLLLVHGGAGTGRVWESTPDGREGYQTIFLRRGYSVYIVDFPRRGRAGLPSFSGAFGNLEGEQIVPNRTEKHGIEYAWAIWRIGPKYPDVFPGQQFPTDRASIDQFFQSLVPTVSDDETVITDALVALLDKIGPMILVTHSQSGRMGWLTAMRRPNLVKAIVSYEPTYLFSDGALPEPIPLFKGTYRGGTTVSEADFERLVRVPVQVVYGDNIPSGPSGLPAEIRRAQMVASGQFAKAINRRGGDAEVLHLPEAGLHGNSHFMFADQNNLAVADQLAQFLGRKGLDGPLRREPWGA